MTTEPIPNLSTEDAIYELTEAIRLTVEYVGTETLPPLPGWTWYDALLKYAPNEADRFLGEWTRRKAGASR